MEENNKKIFGCHQGTEDNLEQMLFRYGLFSLREREELSDIKASKLAKLMI